MRLSSFGRSFLVCLSGGRPSPRRVLRCFLAARRRWPSGRLVLRWSGADWVVDGCFGVCLWWGRG